MSAPPASGKTPANNKAETAAPSKDSKPAITLEEDDEFEDFPVDGMKNTCLLGVLHYSFFCCL